MNNHRNVLYFRILRSIVFPAVVAACWCVGFPVSPAQAAESTPWAEKMFKETTHDFGVVAKGAEVKYAFQFQNIWQEDVHIKRVTSTCGCTTPKYPEEPIKMYERSEIVAVVDTRTFSKRKQAKLTVYFDEPLEAQVELTVDVYIRTDVVVDPGEVVFGSIAEGTQVMKPLTISYAGRKDWRITRIETVSPHVFVKARETLREASTTPGTYNVGYDVEVHLQPDAPSGYINEAVTFVTNDVNENARHIVVPVKARISSAVTIAPTPLQLGQLSSGESVTRNLVVRAEQPFTISDIQCADDSRFSFKYNREAKKIHLVNVTFLATPPDGEVSAVIEIDTDIPSHEKLDVVASGRIVDNGNASLIDPVDYEEEIVVDEDESAAEEEPAAVPATADSDGWESAE